MTVSATAGTNNEAHQPAPTREPTQPAPAEEVSAAEQATEETTSADEAETTVEAQAQEPATEEDSSSLLPESKEEPAEEPTADDQQEEAPKEDPQPTKWEVTGDPNLDAIYDLMSDAGMKPGDEAGIFDKALATGDMNQVDVATLIQKVGKAKATLIMAGATQYYQGTYKAMMETKAKVHEAVGGEQNWNEVRTWAQAKEKADASFGKDLNELRSMLDAGGRSATAAVAELKSLYEAEKGSLQVKMETGSAPASASASTQGAITDYMDYYKQITEARKTGAHPDVIADIQRRRQMGRQQG